MLNFFGIHLKFLWLYVSTCVATMFRVLSILDFFIYSASNGGRRSLGSQAMIFAFESRRLIEF